MVAFFVNSFFLFRCRAQVPSTYLCGNWPVRFASVDATCQHVAVAGRAGVALYSLATRRWKLFGNESQVHPA